MVATGPPCRVGTWNTPSLTLTYSSPSEGKAGAANSTCLASVLDGARVSSNPARKRFTFLVMDLSCVFCTGAKPMIHTHREAVSTHAEPSTQKPRSLVQPRRRQPPHRCAVAHDLS